MQVTALRLVAFSLLTTLGTVACSDNRHAAKTEADMPAKSHHFHMVAIAEGGIHGPYVDACKVWLNQLAAENGFTVDYLDNTDKINEEYLSHYQLFFQMNYPPYAWKPEAAAAFEKAINTGKIGWVGVHHASLIGDFDGYPPWVWWQNIMGGITFKNYIPKFASGVVHVEDPASPIMKDVPDSFLIKKEEWYTYDKSPRLDKNIHVLANVDESSYIPDGTVKMGDHPVVWTNTSIAARNVYIFMGHSPILFEDAPYKQLLKNALFWAAEK